MKKVVIILVLGLFLISVVSAACPDGMVSYWRFETDASDEMGINDGVLGTGIQEPTDTTGILGGAYHFDGDDFIDLGVGDSLKINPITVMSWIKTGSASNWVQIIGNFHYDNRKGYKLGIEPVTGRAYFQIADSSLVYTSIYDVDIADDSWHFIAGVYDESKDNSNLILYVDGDPTEVDIDSAGIISYGLGDKTMIGKTSDSELYFNGEIDEIAIYNRELSGIEIQELYQKISQDYNYCEELPIPPCSDSQIILRLSSATNAQGEVYSENKYPVDICYSDIFDGTGVRGLCTGTTNKVLGLYDTTNAHAEIPTETEYTTDVCYGDLTCQSTTGECSSLGSGYECVVTLSGDTNAHLAVCGETNTLTIVSDTDLITGGGETLIEVNRGSWFDKTVVGSGAKWIWADDYYFPVSNSEVDDYLTLSKTFNIPGEVENADFTFGIDNFLTLRVNGILVSEIDNIPPAECNPTSGMCSDTLLFYDSSCSYACCFCGVHTVDITSYLQGGDNEIRLETVGKGIIPSDTIANPAGVIFKIDVEYVGSSDSYDTKICCEEGGVPPVCTDECTSGEVGCDGNTKWDCEMQPDGCYDKISTDCVGEEICSNGVCELGGFTYWADADGTLITEAQIVLSQKTPLRLYFNNTELLPGTEVSFEIYEYDMFEDDEIRVGDNALIGIVDEHGNVYVTWIMNSTDEISADSDILSDNGNPFKFYFKVNDGEESYKLELTTSEVDLCESFTNCRDYSEEECVKDHCKVASDSVKEKEPNTICGRDYDDEDCWVDTICSCIWDEDGGDGGEGVCGSAKGRIEEPGCGTDYPGTGICFHRENTNDDCDDGFLTYSWLGDWTWPDDNSGISSDPNDEKYIPLEELWYYDPDRSYQPCVLGGANSVPCPAQIQLSFFGVYNLIISVFLIGLVYLFFRKD